MRIGEAHQPDQSSFVVTLPPGRHSLEVEDKAAIIIPFSSVLESLASQQKGNGLAALDETARKQALITLVESSPDELSSVLQNADAKRRALHQITAAIQRTSLSRPNRRQTLLGIVKGLVGVLALADLGGLLWTTHEDNTFSQDLSKTTAEDSEAGRIIDTEQVTIPHGEGDVIPGGFRIIGAGIEMDPEAVASFISSEDGKFKARSGMDDHPTYKIRLLSNAIDTNDVPEVSLSQGNISVRNGEWYINSNKGAYFRLGLLPSIDGGDHADAQVMLIKEFPDGTFAADILTTIDFASHKYRVDSSGSTLYVAHAVTKEQVGEISPFIATAAEFMGHPFTAKIADSASFTMHRIPRIPDYLRKIADSDIILPDRLDRLEGGLQDIIVYHETSRAIIAKLATSYGLPDARKMLEDISQGFATYLHELSNRVYGQSSLSENARTGNANNYMIQNNRLSKLFSITEYVSPNFTYDFGNMQNPHDLLASVLTVWNFFGDTFVSKLSTMNETKNDWEPQPPKALALQMTKDLVSLLALVNPDPTVQTKLVAGLTEVKAAV